MGKFTDSLTQKLTVGAVVILLLTIVITAVGLCKRLSGESQKPDDSNEAPPVSALPPPHAGAMQAGNNAFSTAFLSTASGGGQELVLTPLSHPQISRSQLQ